MGLFDFLKKSDQINNTGVVGLPNVEDVSKEILPEIKREDFVDDSEPILESNAMTIKYGTGMPIDAIYAYIQDDYEQEGYSDAMCNADMAYKESKKEIIKNGLKMLFEQVRLRYESDIRDINVHLNDYTNLFMTFLMEVMMMAELEILRVPKYWEDCVYIDSLTNN